MITLLVIDSLRRVVEKATTTQNINEVEIYKKMMESQAQTYNLILFLFLAIFAAFVGATWLYNRNIARRDIIHETKKIFEHEKIFLINEFKKEYEKELSFLKGESARLFAISLKGNEPSQIMLRFVWWSTCIKNYLICDKGDAVRVIAGAAIFDLKKILEKKEPCKSHFVKDIKVSQTELIEIFNSLPKELTQEKDELLALLQTFFE